MKDEQAEIIALQALAFLAAEPDRLGAFLATTGIGPDSLRTQTQSPELLAGVLDYLLQEDTLLQACCADCQVTPDMVIKARQRFPGFSPW